MIRKLKMGMIGGGEGSFIGSIHRKAAALDGHIELVCGAFSSSAEKSLTTGAGLYLSENRCYASYKEMIASELLLPDDERMDFVSIVTPNHLHFEPAALAMQSGFDVVVDKPITLTLQEAKDLKEISKKNGKTLCLTHTYTGYPMVKEAKFLLSKNKLGSIRKVYVKYPQGWLSTKLEDSQQKQAAWRTDPSKSGMAGSMGDIGTHAFNLVEYMTGLEVTAMCAKISTVVSGRQLDDDGMVLLQFNNGATGSLVATQVAAGEENNLTIEVYGEHGGLEWQHKNPNSLFLKWLDAPMQEYRAGTDYISDLAKFNCRTPAGHPEGFIEAFANIYKNFAQTLVARNSKVEAHKYALDFPGVDDGIRSMAFIENVIAASDSEEKWKKFEL